MWYIKLFSLGILLLLLFLIIVMQRGFPTHQKIIGWIPYWDQKNAFESFSQNTEHFDYVSVFWYRLDTNGNITTYEHTNEDQEIIDTAHRNGVKILALIANLPDYTENADWDYKRVDAAISSDEKREEHIAALVDLVKEKNFDGLDIDYEALRRYQRDDFSLFIEELAMALHREGKLLGVAIHPKTGEFKPEEDNGSHAQDLERIARAADQLYFMTYLEHGTFSGPGPTNSIGWTRNILEYAISDLGIPRHKIFMGIGTFGLQWKENDNGSYEGEDDDLTFTDVQEIVRTHGPEPYWHIEEKSFSFSYEKEDDTYLVWFDNAVSINERIKLAKELGVGGLAFWRLGGEDQKIWGNMPQ